MLELGTEVDFNSFPHIRPICLPTDSNKDYAGVMATVIGWENWLGTLSILMKMEVSVITNNQCRSTWGRSVITKERLCTLSPGWGCSGDTGAPLITKHKASHYELIGVSSYVGPGDCGKHWPSLYLR